MRSLLRQPALWFAALLIWTGTLWLLSSHPGRPHELPVPHLDKVAHFSYFFSGGILFAGWKRSLHPEAPQWRGIITATIIAMALVGILDEWHQCFTPGRSGADPWDWLADLLGGAAGALAAKSAHHRLQ